MIYNGRRDLTDLNQVVANVITEIQDRIPSDSYDSIVVTGISGVMVGAPVSLALRKPLVVVRKETDDSHHGAGIVEGYAAIGDRYLFLDDFISTGKTRTYVQTKIDWGSLPNDGFAGGYTNAEIYWGVNRERDGKLPTMAYEVYYINGMSDQPKIVDNTKTGKPSPNRNYGYNVR